MKEFKSAAQVAGEQQALVNPRPITFSLDGREMTAESATSGQLAYLVAQQSDEVNAADQVHALFSFLKGILDEDDYDFIVAQMRDGVTSAETVMEIVQWLVEEWTTVPTTSAPASPSRRRSTGKPSTAGARSRA